MARNFRIGLALAMLVMGGTALQFGTEGHHVCEKSGVQTFVGYRHVDPKYPAACLVYCLPLGPCLVKLASGAMKDLEPLEKGNCQTETGGLMELAPLGNITSKIQHDLDRHSGACMGMKVLKFHVPLPKCGSDSVSYKSMKKEAGRELCTEYCVPKMRCLEEVQRGFVQYKGVTISEEGSCAAAGFTDAVDMHIDAGRSCPGMVLHKFGKAKTEKPAAPETPRPGVPNTEEPAAPRLPLYRVPDTPRPGVPSMEEPAAPGTPRQGVPGAGGPAAPKRPRNGVPDTPRPDVPGAEEPAAPGTPRQGVPNTEEPAAPKRPDKVPNTEEPGAPGRETPAKVPEPVASRDCEAEYAPFKSVQTYFGKTYCTRYCVPVGLCLQKVQDKAASVRHLEITADGVCAAKDFPEPVTISVLALMRLKGGMSKYCQGMTVRRYLAQPASRVKTEQPMPVGSETLDPAAGRTCGFEFSPFRAVAMVGGTTQCTAYCVPAGRCAQAVQAGGLPRFGISGDGGCQLQDFPTPLPVSSATKILVAHAGGPSCRGMTVHVFQAPKDHKPQAAET